MNTIKSIKIMNLERKDSITFTSFDSFYEKFTNEYNKAFTSFAAIEKKN